MTASVATAVTLSVGFVAPWNLVITAYCNALFW